MELKIISRYPIPRTGSSLAHDRPSAVPRVAQGRASIARVAARDAPIRHRGVRQAPSTIAGKRRGLVRLASSYSVSRIAQREHTLKSKISYFFLLFCHRMFITKKKSKIIKTQGVFYTV